MEIRKGFYGSFNFRLGIQKPRRAFDVFLWRFNISKVVLIGEKARWQVFRVSYKRSLPGDGNVEFQWKEWVETIRKE